MTFPDSECMTLEQNNSQLNRDTRFRARPIFNAPLPLPDISTSFSSQCRDKQLLDPGYSLSAIVTVGLVNPPLFQHKTLI